MNQKYVEKAKEYRTWMLKDIDRYKKSDKCNQIALQCMSDITDGVNLMIELREDTAASCEAMKMATAEFNAFRMLIKICESELKPVNMPLVTNELVDQWSQKWIGFLAAIQLMRMHQFKE
jgi:hypothetical protein